MTVKKCVLFVCETVSIDGEISLREVSGPCQRNLVLEVDNARSSPILKDTYSKLSFSICFKNKGEVASLVGVASAVHGPRYQRGLVRNQLLALLKLQFDPMIAALGQSLKANEGKRP